MYILTNYEKCEDGVYNQVALPPGCEFRNDFAQISCGDAITGFALCGIGYIDRSKIALPAEVVPDPLSSLMSSGERYPPAIAIARGVVERPHDGFSRADFITRLAERLQELLDDQPNSPYFLARCVVTGVGYKSADSYYWIVGWRVLRDGEIMVKWVSDDCFIYGDPLDNFDVTEERMTARFGVPKPFQPSSRSTGQG